MRAYHRDGCLTAVDRHGVAGFANRLNSHPGGAPDIIALPSKDRTSLLATQTHRPRRRTRSEPRRRRQAVTAFKWRGVQADAELLQQGRPASLCSLGAKRRCSDWGTAEGIAARYEARWRLGAGGMVAVVPIARWRPTSRTPLIRVTAYVLVTIQAAPIRSDVRTPTNIATGPAIA